MAYIRTVAEEEAEGLLADLYEQARSRAGKIYNILRIQSVNPRLLRRGIELYVEAMKGRSPLTRAQREMMAVVVSKVNDCHY